MTRLFYGPDAVAVDNRAFEWASNRSDGTPESVLYITNQSHRVHRLEERWRSVGRPLELTALTLDDFVERCYDRTAVGSATSRMDQPTRLRLVERALADLPERSSLVDGDGLPPSGLVEQVEDLLSLLEFAGLLSPEAVRTRLADEGLPNLSAELGAVTERFYAARDALEDGPETTLWAERYQRVADADLSRCFPNTDAVVVGGFDTFSVLAERVVETTAETWPTAAALSRLTDTDRPRGVDIGAESAWEFLAEDLDFDAERVVPRESCHTPNRRLAQAPFRPDTPDVSLEETTVDTVVPSSLTAEVRFVGRQVQELLADDVQPDDIGVVVTSPTAYNHRLAEELDARSVPVAAARDFDLDGTPTGGALLDALEFVEAPSVETLQSLLGNPLVEPELPDWEDTSAATVSESLADDEVGELSEVAESVEVPIEALLDRAEAIGATGTVEAFRTFVAELGIRDAVENRTTAKSQNVVFRGAERVLDAIERTADEVGGSSREGVEIAFEDSGTTELERVRHALTAVSVTDDPAVRDGHVDVLDATEVDMRTFEHVFVLGLTASHFPSDADRLDLVNAVTESHSDFAEVDQARRAEYRIAGLVAAAESATLSRPKQQFDGTEYIDAGILAELRRITDSEPTPRDEFGHVVGTAPESNRDTVGARVDAQHALAVAGGASGRETLRRHVSGARGDGVIAGTPGSSDGLDASVTPEATARRGIDAASDRGDARPSEYNGWLARETVDRLGFAADRLSPTQVESYAACPFRFYAEDVLGLEDEDRDDEPLVRGRFLHTVLAAFYETLGNRDGTPVSLAAFESADLESRLLDIVVGAIEDRDEDLDERWLFEVLAGLGDAEQNPYYNRTAIDGRPEGILVRFLAEELALYTDADDRLQDGPITTAPSWFEEKLTLDTGRVRIGGVLDRGEITPDGKAIIRDYKTGNTPSERDTLDGLSFQLPLYAKMLESNVDEVTEAVGGGYYRLKKPRAVSSTAGQVGFVGEDPANASWRGTSYRDGYGGTPMVYRGSDKPSIETREGFREFLDNVVPSRLDDIAAGIESGTFHPTVNEAGDAGCGGCPFRDACDVRSHRRQRFTETIADREREAYVPPIARGDEWTPTAEAGED